ncbi:AAA family ATPase [Paenibacillus sp. SYP-B4298]|uniref:AAA family ATPase n=1 Tax=Paenibacillus sp. SYP-B4298 TaxID=2996034 RepID=UPI0022DCE436|nr:AAA family ATPase [Paenibacillus sp. SYP-B4298]
MIIQTRLHTIFMLIGPTECGKTTFAREVLVPGLQLTDESRNLRTNVQYLSSDELRQTLLGYPYDKYDQQMMEASGQAFQLLFERLRLATSYPVQAEFVIIDTTGLAEDFRAKVREIAHENNYRLEAIVFDYRSREDYYASERSKKLISNHINRLRKEVLGQLARESYDKVHKVRAKDFYMPQQAIANPAYTVEIENAAAYAATVLPQGQQYIMIGDVHECVEELQGLLRDYGFQIEHGQLIAGDKARHMRPLLVGDWIDKGKQTREIVQFLHRNREQLYLVLGNHENFVYKYLKGEIAGADPALLETYFDSVRILEGDEELRVQFNELVEQSQPFYRYIGSGGPSFIVTHAPCRTKYLGKLDLNSLRHQRSYRIDREAPLEEQLAFLREEAVGNHPYHVFGHVAAAQPFRIRNKLHLDSGCVHGYALSSAVISFKPFMKSHASQQTALPEELNILFKHERKVAVEELGEDELRRLHYCSRNQINYISGTMSPADKDEQAQELESLRRGLEAFSERGVKHVVLQPKYMGSRCNIYLHRELESCYAVSRNGYRIRKVELTAIYERLLERFDGYMKEHKLAMMVLDGELLPWKALGEGLIERQFKPIERALETELAFLEQTGFEQAVNQLITNYEASGFEQEQHRMAKGALSDKYGSSTYQTYKHVSGVREAYVPLADHIAALATYKRQLELYGSDQELDYKPFAILKWMNEDGREEVPDMKVSTMYALLSEDEALVLDLSEPDCLERAERYFEQLTVEKQMEGVVIKPDVWDGRTVPYLKVRNREYLSIVYGYDYMFPHKHRKLIKQKNITRKLRTSLNEYRLGLRMLQVPFHDISPEHQGYREIAAGLLFETAQEKEMDPRL